jgi:hypothetical protein
MRSYTGNWVTTASSYHRAGSSPLPRRPRAPIAFGIVGQRAYVSGHASLKRSLALRFRNDRDACTGARAAIAGQALAASAAEAVAQRGPHHQTGPQGYPDPTAQTEGGPA